ncbi:MAG: hypothetical protein ABEJ08_05875 [Halobacteriaceae archaeon]
MSDDGDRSRDMTLALDRAAVERLAEPQAAMADARRFTVALGVVGDDHRRVAHLVREADLPQDFFPGPRSKAGALRLIADQFDTERHVFVGTGPGDRDLAEQLGWEYLDVETAADRAGWTLAEPARDGRSWIDRLRAALRAVLG